MQKPKLLSEIILFLSVFVIYCLCTSNTINFWDSPEFITSSYTLQSSHPPGAPLYTVFCSFILLFFSAENAALVSNIISAFFGAVTVVMVFKITYHIAVDVLENKTSIKNKYPELISGLLAALSLAFSTSFWTASIEAEVYTMSFALMTGMIYVLLLWYKCSSETKSNRLLLLFFLLLGLSVGVHLILISIIIPFSVLAVYKKYTANIKNISIALLVGIVGFFTLHGLIINGIIKLASVVDIYAVNDLKFPVNSGAIFVFLIIIFGLLLTSLFSKKRGWTKMVYTSTVILIFLLGSSSYVITILRSDVNTLVAEKVDTADRLSSYISAQRFGVENIPLIYGPTYNAQLDNNRPFSNTKPILTYDSNKKSYIVAHDGVANKINYSSKFKTIFPRMYDANNASNYAAWTTIRGKEINHKVKNEVITFIKPTFFENFGFFINYQLNWLNFRYLLWNFSGRQNDYHGLGYVKNGNWISGFNFIDKSRIGDESYMPEYYKKNKGYDAYYFLPFILGLLGLIGLLKHRAYLLFTLLLFLTFGLGITVYVNPLPSSILIRERDYIFIGSFIMFSIWIGLSLPFLINYVREFANKKSLLIISCVILFISAPIQLFAKGWDNHQNSGDTFAYDFAKTYLDSCPEQAILITNGDNMTFPLWYLQDVEGYRTDVRVINFDQLNIDTHIDNLKLKKLTSESVTIDLDKSLYINGIEKIIPLQKETDKPVNLEVLTQFLNSKKTLTNWNGRLRHYIPGNSFELPIDTTSVFNKTFLQNTYNTKLVSKIAWNYNKEFYGLNDIIIFNLIKNNISKRAICFANNGKENHLVGLKPFLIQKGMISELAPMQRNKKDKNPKLVDTEVSYKQLVENVNFKAFNSINTYIKDENRTYAQEILRQNYYFLAQALFEENKIEKAKKTIDTCLKLFPNSEVAYKQYAFALGRLYYRMGYKDLANKVCNTAMQNIWKELQWITSFDSSNPIINVRHAKSLLNIYSQMAGQIAPFEPESSEQTKQKLFNYSKEFEMWYKNNWPY